MVGMLAGILLWSPCQAAPSPNGFAVGEKKNGTKAIFDQTSLSLGAQGREKPRMGPTPGPGRCPSRDRGGQHAADERRAGARRLRHRPLWAPLRASTGSAEAAAACMNGPSERCSLFKVPHPHKPCYRFPGLFFFYNRERSAKKNSMRWQKLTVP